MCNIDPDGDIHRYLHSPAPPSPIASFPSFGHYDGDIHRYLHSPAPPPPIASFSSFGHYDPDDDIHHHLHSTDPPPDITLLAAPVQDNVPPRNVDFEEALIRDLPFPTQQDGNPRSSSRLNPGVGQQAFTPIQLDQLGVMNYSTFGKGEEHFEVYGSHDIFHHGLIYFQSLHEGDRPSKKKIKFIDFRNENFGSVKNYINDYRMSKKNHGHIPVIDTLSNLIMGSAAGSSNVEESYTPPVPDFGQISKGESLQFRTGCTSETGRDGHTGHENKTPLATQRVRTKNLRLKDLQPLLYLPRECAAQELNLSLTTFKKVCCQNGIDSWPYKKADKSQEPSEKTRAQRKICKAI